MNILYTKIKPLKTKATELKAEVLAMQELAKLRARQLHMAHDKEEKVGTGFRPLFDEDGISICLQPFSKCSRTYVQHVTYEQLDMTEAQWNEFIVLLNSAYKIAEAKKVEKLKTDRIAFLKEKIKSLQKNKEDNSLLISYYEDELNKSKYGTTNKPRQSRLP